MNCHGSDSTGARPAAAQEKGEEGLELGQKVKVVFEKIILVSNKKVGPKDVQFLQINFQKLPENRNVGVECSEHLLPTSVENSEITFVLEKYLGEFQLDLKKDISIDNSQYKVELEMMIKRERKVIGSFDIRRCDIEPQSSKKTKLRKIQPQIKTLQTIELKYKVFPCPEECQHVQNNLLNENDNISTAENNPFGSTHTEIPEVSHEMSPRHHMTPIFKPRSCIVVG